MPIHCDLVSHDRMLFSGEVDMVIAPGCEGELGILPHHAPLITLLNYGILRVRQGGQETAYAIAGGVMDVQPDAVTILADTGERVDEIDVARAEAAKARAEALLQQPQAEGTAAYLKAQTSLRRSELRLDAARKYRKG
jgi:F-type H+-transporting ATPase subunit epsilon